MYQKLWLFGIKSVGTNSYETECIIIIVYYYFRLVHHHRQIHDACLKEISYQIIKWGHVFYSSNYSLYGDLWTTNEILQNHEKFEQVWCSGSLFTQQSLGIEILFS